MIAITQIILCEVCCAVGLSLASFSFIAIVILTIFGTLIKTIAGNAVKVK